MKKLAVFALTRQGALLGVQLANILPEYQTDVYLSIDLLEKITRPNNLIKEYDQVQLKVMEKSLKEELTGQFTKYDGFIMIMALGIVVRSFASLIEDKRIDPAVLCLDEKGKFVISVLSGHLGGANELTAVIGERIKAMPVITTATDVNKTIAFDLIAKRYNLTIEPFDNLKYFNGAMVNGDQVIVFTELELPFALRKEFQEKGVKVLPLTKDRLENGDDYHCIISSRNLPGEPGKNNLFLRPRNLIVGLGCRRDTNAQLIINAIRQGFDKINQSLGSIKKIVSVDIKADEQGILEAAKYLRVPVEFFASSQLKEVFLQHSLAKSEFVNQKIGVEGVCEPAAIFGGNNPQLILKKTIFPRTTIAIAQEKFMWSGWDRETLNK